MAEESARSSRPRRGVERRLAGYAALAVAFGLAPIVIGRDPLSSLAVLLGLMAGVWAVFMARASLARDGILLFQCLVELLAIGGMIWSAWSHYAPLSWERVGLFAAGAIPTAVALTDAWRCGVLVPIGRERRKTNSPETIPSEVVR